MEQAQIPDTLLQRLLNRIDFLEHRLIPDQTQRLDDQQKTIGMIQKQRRAESDLQEIRNIQHETHGARVLAPQPPPEAALREEWMESAKQAMNPFAMPKGSLPAPAAPAPMMGHRGPGSACPSGAPSVASCQTIKIDTPDKKQATDELDASNKG